MSLSKRRRRIYRGRCDCDCGHGGSYVMRKTMRQRRLKYRDFVCLVQGMLQAVGVPSLYAKLPAAKSDLDICLE
jgi:hypothetical protein